MSLATPKLIQYISRACGAYKGVTSIRSGYPDQNITIPRSCRTSLDLEHVCTDWHYTLCGCVRDQSVYHDRCYIIAFSCVLSTVLHLINREHNKNTTKNENNMNTRTRHNVSTAETQPYTMPIIHTSEMVSNQHIVNTQNFPEHMLAPLGWDTLSPFLLGILMWIFLYQ